MSDLSHFSDEELARAAGLPVGPTPAQAPSFDPLGHMSDEELERIANGSHQAPEAPHVPQNDSWWREPALAASGMAKGALQTWAHQMDATGTAVGVPAQAQMNLINRMTGDAPEQPLTNGVVNNQAKNEAVFRDAGITDRPDLKPQNVGEKVLNAASEGVGSGLSMGQANPRALLSFAGSSVGSKAAHSMAPDSDIAPLIGGLVGGLMPAALETAGRFGMNLGRNALGSYDPSVRADEIIAKKLTADQSAPTEISDMMGQFPDKPLTIADLGGDATKRLARTVTDTPTDASAQATKLLQNRDLGTGVSDEFDMMRQGGTADRIVGDIKKALGSDDALKTIDELVAKGDAESAPLYQKFYEGLPTPARQVQPFMQSPTFRSALGRANASLLDEGKPPLTDYIDFNEAGDPMTVTGKAFPPETLDRIKQGVDDAWLAAKASGDRGQARTANTLRTRYLSFLDAKYPDYAPARSAFAGPAQARDAIQSGMDVFNTAPEDVASTLKGLEPENRDMFRLGVQKALLGKVMNTADGANEVRAIFGNPAKRASVSAAFDNPDALTQLSRSLGVENRMFATKNINGNSRTAPSLMDQADLAEQFGKAKDLAEGGVSLLDGNFFTAVKKFTGPLVHKFGGPARDETTGLLAQRLFNPDLEQNQQRLALIQALMENPKPGPNMMGYLPSLNSLAIGAGQESRQ